MHISISDSCGPSAGELVNLIVYVASYLVRAGIGFILICAALIKFLSPIEDLEKSVLGYQILNGSIARLFARTLPWAEISIGVALIANKSQEIIVVAAFGLLAVFTLSIGYALIRGIETEWVFQ